MGGISDGSQHVLDSGNFSGGYQCLMINQCLQGLINQDLFSIPALLQCSAGLTDKQRIQRTQLSAHGSLVGAERKDPALEQTFDAVLDVDGTSRWL